MNALQRIKMDKVEEEQNGCILKKENKQRRKRDRYKELICQIVLFAKRKKLKLDEIKKIAKFFKGEGEIVDAIELFIQCGMVDEAIRLVPGLEEQGKVTLAISYYTQFGRYRNLAQVYEAKGDYEKAAMIRKAITPVV